MCNRAITNSEIDHSAFSKAREHTIGRELHPVDKLAFAIDDVVDRTGINVLTGSDPEISIEVHARRSRSEGGPVVGQLAWRNHRKRWKLSTGPSSSTPYCGHGLIAARRPRHGSRLRVRCWSRRVGGSGASFGSGSGSAWATPATTRPFSSALKYELTATRSE